MSLNTGKWTPIAIPIAYLVTAHLAFTLRSPILAAIAAAVLVVAGMTLCRGRFAWALRALIACAGAALVASIGLGDAPPFVLFLPPVLIPSSIAWLFGHTLAPGRVPLVERIARAVHAPEELEPAVRRYARSVTWMWTLLLAGMALVNLVLAANLTPGGLLDLAGRVAPWPVSADTYTWVSNVGTYLLIGATLVVEYTVRLMRFPHYRFRDPVQFVRRVRARLPDVMKEVPRD